MSNTPNEQNANKSLKNEINRQKKLKLTKLQSVSSEQKKICKKKINELTFQFHKDYHEIVGDDKPNKKMRIKKLKANYDNQKLKIQTDCDYEIAKYLLTEGAQKRRKMHIDKKIAYHLYKTKANELKDLYVQSLKDLKQSQKVDKQNYKKALKSAQTKNEKLAVKSEYAAQVTNFESKNIKVKVDYRNELIQLQQQRDLSYQYEIDISFKLKRWFYGVGKEFQRMTWPSLNKTFRDYFIVTIVSIIIALIFLAVDALIALCK